MLPDQLDSCLGISAWEGLSPACKSKSRDKRPWPDVRPDNIRERLLSSLAEPVA